VKPRAQPLYGTPVELSVVLEMLSQYRWFTVRAPERSLSTAGVVTRVQLLDVEEVMAFAPLDVLRDGNSTPAIPEAEGGVGMLVF